MAICVAVGFCGFWYRGGGVVCSWPGWGVCWCIEEVEEGSGGGLVVASCARNVEETEGEAGAVE